MTKVRLLAYLLALGGVTVLQAAVTSTVTITNSSVSASDRTALENSTNSSFQTASTSQFVGFLNAMAAAQAVSSNSVGREYSSNSSIFVVGGGFSGGVNPGNNSLSDVFNGNAFKGSTGVPSVRSAAQVGFFAGLSLSKFSLPSLGPIDLKKFTVFFNFGGYTFDQVKPYTIKTNSFGIHFQYRLIEAKSMGLGFLNWGGVLIGTGFDISSNKYTATSSSDTSGSNLTWKPTGTITIENNAFVIPIEAVTSVRLLYAFSFIGGAGIDIISAKSDVVMSLAGPITSSTLGNVGTASVTGTESGKSSAFGVRAIGGIAINLVPLKNTNVLSLFVIGNLGTHGLGVKVGVQGAF